MITQNKYRLATRTKAVEFDDLKTAEHWFKEWCSHYADVVLIKETWITTHKGRETIQDKIISQKGNYPY